MKTEKEAIIEKVEREMQTRAKHVKTKLFIDSFDIIIIEE